MSDLKQTLAEFLKILADPTRLEILDFLKKKEEKSVGDLEKSLGRPQSTISQQLKVLTNANLLTVRREGRKRLYRISDPQIFKIISSLYAFISARNEEKIDEFKQ